ncbi:MAG: ATP-binding protein [Thiobacillus sp.]|nr:ATP-binding protein [Thiobacillus sp.]
MHRLGGNELRLNPAILLGFVALASGACGLFAASVTMQISPFYRVAGVLLSVAIWTGLLGYFVARLSLMRVSAQRYESVFNALAEGIVVLDRQARIVAINDTVTRLLGYEAASLLGNDISTLVSAQGREQIEDFLRSTRTAAGTPVAPLNTQTEARRADGACFPIRLNLCDIPLLDHRIVCSFHDITRQALAESSLSQAKEEAEHTLAVLTQKERVIELSLLGAGAGYWHLDFGTGTLTLDDHALAMLCLNRSTFGGRYADWANQIHPDDFPWTQGALMDAMSDEHASHYVWDYRVVCSEHITRYLHITGNIERNQDGAPLTAYGLNFDITDEKDAAIALGNAKDEAEIANKAKSSFLAAMSHEIRTPMNGVVGMIDVLGHTPLNSEQEDLIKTIRDSAFGLLNIIDDILDFSKIEAGRLEIERLPVDLHSVLEGVGDTLYPLIEKKNIQLFTFCDPALPQVYGDPIRLRQILFNLAGNAAKFTGNDRAVAGRIVIRIEAAPSSVAGRIRLGMHIEDNGIGISPDVQSRLFRPFSQAEGSTTRKYGGTGLGLTICRRLADLMGGQIELQSTEGKGSTFSVWLDLETVPQQRTPPRYDLSGLSIPLLCFDQTVSTFLERYLAHAGAAVWPTLDSEALSLRAQELASRDAALVIVVDTMGDSRIGQLLRESLIEDLPGISVKFVFLERGNRRYPRPTGDDSLAIDLDALHREKFLLAVAAVSGRSPLETERLAQSAETRRAPMTVEVAEALGQLILIAEDNATNQKVLLHQLGMLGYAAEVAGDGRIALEKWRSGRYGMLLTDCHMPEMDGYELSHAIRAEENSGQHLPIVAITADALKGTDKQCIAAGMDDYLTKPIRMELLKEKILKWMPLPTTAEPVEPTEPTAEAQPATPAASGPDSGSGDDATVVDVQSLIEVLGMDDPAMLADFYRDFLRSGESTVTEMQQAYQDRKPDEIGRLAHRLKSSARTVGAHALADCCLALEQAGKQADLPVIDTQMGAFPALFCQVRTWIGCYTQSTPE